MDYFQITECFTFPGEEGNLLLPLFLLLTKFTSHLVI